MPQLGVIAWRWLRLMQGPQLLPLGIGAACLRTLLAMLGGVRLTTVLQTAQRPLMARKEQVW
jgi:hypothetical protein